MFRGCVASITTAPGARCSGPSSASADAVSSTTRSASRTASIVWATETSTSPAMSAASACSARCGPRDEGEARAGGIAGEEPRDRRADASARADDGDVRLRCRAPDTRGSSIRIWSSTIAAVNALPLVTAMSRALAERGAAGGDRGRERAEADDIRPESDGAVDRSAHPAPAALDVREQVPRAERHENHVADALAADLHARDRHRRKRQAPQGRVVDGLRHESQAAAMRARDPREGARGGGR